MAKHPASVLVASALLDRAEDVCQRRLMRDRDNPSAHCAMAEIYRKQGRLIDAAAAYRRAALLSPASSDASRMAALLAGLPAPAAAGGVRSAPFMHIKDVLPSSARDVLRSRGVWNAAERIQACVRALLPAFLPRLQVAVSRLGEEPITYAYFFD